MIERVAEARERGEVGGARGESESAYSSDRVLGSVVSFTEAKLAVVAAPKERASFWVACSFRRPLAIASCFGLLYTRQ
jgi:hypothetical protein